MSKYNFITDNLRFSNSSLNCYTTCPLAFKLTYIDAEQRSTNWYAQIGILVHLVLEKFFKNEIEKSDMSYFFKDNYNKFITCPPPNYPANVEESYYNDITNFFDNFEFNKDLYEIMFIENALKFDYHNSRFVVKPDLLLKEKYTNKLTLFDYKTAKIFKNGKVDKRKLSGYKDQLYLYAIGLWLTRQIQVDNMIIWFIRENHMETFEMSIDEQASINEKVIQTLYKIHNDEEFKANKDNQFFCSNLCSVSSICRQIS